jgi:hypothetical protein
MSESLMEERYRQEQARIAEAERAARDTRGAAGMGFWRLTFIVAVGILIAQVISAVALWIIKVISPPAS